MLSKIEKVLRFAEENDLYPDVYLIRGPSTEVKVSAKLPADKDYKEVLMFSSNNYLGIATDPRIKKVLRENTERYGMGSGGSRLVTGNIEIQEELENSIAQFKNYEAAITFSSGYMANIGTIPAILNVIEVSAAGDFIRKHVSTMLPVVFSDETNHASIVDACRVAKAEKIIYHHRDLGDLESKLKKISRSRTKLIITDGVFSMDGDIAPLPEIMELAETYGAMVMVDDAHATGILGENGVGTNGYFKLRRNPDIMMGTFSKAFGAVGGFVAGSKRLIKYLRVMARTHMFSAPIPPAIAAGIVEAIRIVRRERGFEKLLENVSYLVPHLKEMGCNTLGSGTQIIPILIGAEEEAIAVSRWLFGEGIFVPAMRWPAVPKNTARLRITLMSSHTHKHLDTLLTKLREVKNLYRF